MQDIYYDLRIQYACKSRLDNTSEDALFSATGEQFWHLQMCNRLTRIGML